MQREKFSQPQTVDIRKNYKSSSEVSMLLQCFRMINFASLLLLLSLFTVFL